MTDEAGMTKKTSAVDTLTGDVDKTTTGIMAKTEAGDGMFGADLDMDSLTDSDDEDDDDDDDKVNVARDKKETKQKTDAVFKIVTGEDSDSIFEERLQNDAKFEDMDYEDYDDEAWNLDDYNDMNE